MNKSRLLRTLVVLAIVVVAVVVLTQVDLPGLLRQLHGQA